MRYSFLMLTCLGVACAHGQPQSMRKIAQPPKAPMQASPLPHGSEGERSGAQGQTASLVQEEHPALELRATDKPPASAAARPTTLPETAGGLDMAMPPPTPTAAPIHIQPVDKAPPKAAVPPSKPASATQVTNPLAGRKPPLVLGAEIAAADAELRERIQRLLLQRSDLSYTARHAGVDVKDRNITVRGQVRTEHERSEVEALIRKLDAVRGFRSELEVINSPPGPD